MHSPASCHSSGSFPSRHRSRLWRDIYFIAGFIFGALAGFGLCFALFVSMEGRP